ncbi:MULTISPECIES: FCD domain-containing protein [unclassified Roseitalea]|uniref:FadR/GntR family transcriptional regulator n=1 Tax=unclassified Roseitalea TaxID=2639107 RepID=UPI00273EA253|nr:MULTISPECIES: FCD domain-containing protein [unclassified Roseitalea]
MAEPQLREQPGENAPTPAREESAVDTLVHAIKGFIQENNLQIGDALPSERELGERFDAARNTVREAVRTLKAYGVVDVRPKVGAVIVNRHMDAVLDLFSFQLTMNRKTFIDIQGFRRLIEVGSVDAIVEAAGEADIAALTRINAAIPAAPSVHAAARSDFEFHRTLLALIGNKTVLDVYTTMAPIMIRLMETGKETDGLQGTFDTHARIIDALRRRDRLAYQYLMSAHLDHGLRYIDRSVANGGPGRNAAGTAGEPGVAGGAGGQNEEETQP